MTDDIAGASTLLWPLLVVSQEDLNHFRVRYWALRQLRRIGSSLGIRQPNLAADGVSRSLNTFGMV
jgi:hypothetical protein